MPSSSSQPVGRVSGIAGRVDAFIFFKLIFFFLNELMMLVMQEKVQFIGDREELLVLVQQELVVLASQVELVLQVKLMLFVCLFFSC
jgi:hypothetical protein